MIIQETPNDLKRRRLLSLWKNVYPVNNELNVLDVGCGRAEFFSFMADNWRNPAYAYFGIDQPGPDLQWAIDNYAVLSPRVQFQTADILNLIPPPDLNVKWLVHHIVSLGCFHEGYGQMGEDWDYPGIEKRIKAMLAIANEGVSLIMRQTVYPAAMMLKAIRGGMQLPVKIDHTYDMSEYTVFIGKRWNNQMN